MIPLRDDIPTLRFAYVTYGLIVLNGLVFIYELFLGGEGLARFIQQWGLVPADVVGTIRSGAFDLRILATLLTSTFIHAGWVHFLGNMLYLHIFGNNVEDSMGRVRFVVFYLLIGIAANLGQILVAADSAVPGIGASGAIAGVLGAYLILYPRARVLVLIPAIFIWPILRLPAAVVLVFWFVIQLFQGALVLATGQAGMGGVAFWVHATGFALGMGLILLFRDPRLTGRKPTWA